MTGIESNDLNVPAFAIIIVVLLSIGIAYVLLKPQTSSDSAEVKTGNYEVKNINSSASKNMIEANENDPDFVLLDVRTPEEFSNGHLENATLLNYYEKSFSDDLDKLDRSKTYLVYCRTGSRSANAAWMMIDMGFTDVYNMLGGITEWKELGYETVAE